LLAAGAWADSAVAVMTAAAIAAAQVAQRMAIISCLPPRLLGERAGNAVPLRLWGSVSTQQHNTKTRR
jgi:hypothetical protein